MKEVREESKNEGSKRGRCERSCNPTKGVRQEEVVVERCGEVNTGRDAVQRGTWMIWRALTRIIEVPKGVVLIKEVDNE